MRTITSKLNFPRAIGHRGLAALAPENTLAGIRCAKEHDFQWVEFDVRLSRDQVPIVLHDATLERTTSGTGHASNYTLNELRQLDAGHGHDEQFRGEPIPTLEEVLTLCTALQLGANVEIKTDDEDAATIRPLVEASLLVIKRHLTQMPLLVSSMDERVIELCAKHAPQIPRGYLVDATPNNLDALLARMNQLGCVSFHCPVSAISRELLDAVQTSGRPVLAFTIKKAESAAPLFTLGVDSVFSDVPIENAALPVTRAT